MAATCSAILHIHVWRRIITETCRQVLSVEVKVCTKNARNDIFMATTIALYWRFLL